MKKTYIKPLCIVTAITTCSIIAASTTLGIDNDGQLINDDDDNEWNPFKGLI